MKIDLKSIWRKSYVYLIPILITIGYFIFRENINLLCSKNIEKALEVIVTFVSISIGLFGVFLSNLISAKDNSKMICYFFESADTKAFINSVKYNILSGLITVLLSAILIMQDVLINSKNVLILIWIWILTSYCLSTYRFMSIMLTLSLKNKVSVEKKDSQVVTGVRKDKLDDLIKRNNPPK